MKNVCYFSYYVGTVQMWWHVEEWVSLFSLAIGMLTCCNPSDWRWPLALLTTLQSYFITPLTTFCLMMAPSKSLTSWSRGLQKLQNFNLVTFSWGRRLTALNGISTHSWSENCLTNLFEHRLFAPRLCQGLWLQFRFKTPPSCWEVWHGTPRPSLEYELSLG